MKTSELRDAILLLDTRMKNIKALGETLRKKIEEWDYGYIKLKIEINKGLNGNIK